MRSSTERVRRHRARQRELERARPAENQTTGRWYYGVMTYCPACRTTTIIDVRGRCPWDGTHLVGLLDLARWSVSHAAAKATRLA